MKQIAIGVVAILTLSTSISPAHSSAGYYPVRMGEYLTVQVCLPASASSPILLQVSEKYGSWKTVAKILFKTLKKDSYCSNLDAQSKNLFLLSYKWKVNEVGSLNFYDSKSKKTYLGWPDGVTKQ